MKNINTTEQAKKWAAQMRKDSSLVIYEDAQGNKFLGRKVHEYAAQLIKNLQNGSIVKPQDKPLVGVRSFDGKMLPKGTRHLVLGVRVGFDNTLADNATPVEADLAGLNFANAVVGKFKNAEFRITQGNQELLRTTLSNVNNWRSSTSNDDDYLAVEPFVLRDQTSFDFNVKLPDGTDAKNYAYRLEYEAIEYVDSINA